MAGTAKARMNHYQVLGVSPTASGDEIAHAFARESSIFRPHVFGGLTEVCVAYEVLRDPIKRRAYDVSIGLERKPEPPKLSRVVRGVATAETMVRAAAVERRAPAPASPPKPEPAAAKPALPLGPGADSNIRPEPSLGRGDPPPLPLAEALDAEVRPIDWKRTGLTLGGFLLAACTLGGVAGWWSASGISEAAAPENSVSVPLPAAKPVAMPPAPEIAATPAADPTIAAPRLDRPRPAIAAPPRTERTLAAPEPAAAEALAPQGKADQESVELAAEATPAIAASMPLSNRTIARTIERIGYSCGSVASTAPVEGAAAGVYKVTCSSGQAYQAKPVNGRYRFRRLGR